MKYKVGMDAEVTFATFYELEANSEIEAIAAAKKLWPGIVHELGKQLPDGFVEHWSEGKAWIEYWDGDNVETVPEEELVNK
jgi:hypothetical protein